MASNEKSELNKGDLYNLFYNALYYFNMGGEENAKTAYAKFTKIAEMDLRYKAEEDNPHYYLGYITQYPYNDT